MLWTDGNTIFCIFGVESQTAVDKKMVARVMLYDILDYMKQVRENPNDVRPVITFILYYGEKPWTGPRTLKELVKFVDGAEQLLLPYFNDFKLNIIDFHTISPEMIEKNPGDFRFYSTFLYNAAHRDNKIEFPGVEDVALVRKFVRVFCNEEDEIEISDETLKQGGYTMNQLIANYLDIERMENARVFVANHRDEWLEEGLEKGREEGLEKGREEERRANARKMSERGSSNEEIADFFDVDPATVQAWLERD